MTPGITGVPVLEDIKINTLLDARDSIQELLLNETRRDDTHVIVFIRSSVIRMSIVEFSIENKERVCELIDSLRIDQSVIDKYNDIHNRWTLAENVYCPFIYIIADRNNDHVDIGFYIDERDTTSE